MSEHVNKPGRYFLAAFILIFAVVMADQASKWFVLETMLRTKGTSPDFWQWFKTRELVQFFVDQQETYKSVTLTPFLNFQMVWNRGISFGMLESDSSKMPIAFIALSLVISVCLFVWMAVARGRLLFFALPLIIGGAIGNVCDRIRFGAVADFIDVHVAGRHWPAFNIADSCICIGAALLIIHAIFDKSDDKKTEEA